MVERYSPQTLEAPCWSMGKAPRKGRVERKPRALAASPYPQSLSNRLLIQE